MALVIVTVTVVLALTSGPWVARQVAIDRCLDNGGRFDYEANECSGTRPGG